MAFGLCPLAGGDDALGALPAVDRQLRRLGVTRAQHCLLEVVRRLATLASGRLGIATSDALRAILPELGGCRSEERLMGAGHPDQRSVGDQLVAVDERLLDRGKELGLFGRDGCLDQLEHRHVAVDADEAVDVVSTTSSRGNLDIPESQEVHHVAANRQPDVIDALFGRDLAGLRLATAAPVDRLGVGDDAPVLAGVLELGR